MSSKKKLLSSRARMPDHLGPIYCMAKGLARGDVSQEWRPRLEITLAPDCLP
jgi:hypothetical protein